MALLDPKDPMKLGVSSSPATNPINDFNKPKQPIDEWDFPIEEEVQEWDQPIAPEATQEDYEQPIPEESVSDPYGMLSNSTNVYSLPSEDDVFKPQTFEEYRFEQETEDQDINWTGAWDNSLIRHTIEWGRQVLDDDYVPQDSMIGRVQQDLELRDTLEAMGSPEGYTADNRDQAEDIWTQRHALKYKNYLDEQALTAEFPSMKEFKEAVSNDPKRFFKGMLQEMVNKPELILLPEVAAARGAAAAAAAAQAINLGAKGTQVAVVTGGVTGAAAGGMTIGTIDRALQQSTNQGEIDMLRAMEQSQVDAMLGVVVHGGARAITKGVSSINRGKAVSKQAKEFSNKATLNTLDEMDELRYRTEVQRATEDPAIEAWVDENGNIYNYEVREVLDADKLKGQIVGLNNLKKQAGVTTSDRELLNVELDRVNKELEDNTLNAGQLQKLIDKKSELSLEAETIPTRGQAAEQWFTGSEKSVVDDQELMTVQDATGVSHTLKRVVDVDKDLVNIEGIQGVDLTGNFKVQEQNNKLFEFMKDYTVSATASLEKAAKMSPTAKLLLDSINPRSRNGRSPINTIQENTSYMQGQYTIKSLDIKTKMDNLGVPEEAVRDHMRGVTISEDPSILEVAGDVRALLDNAKDYAKGKGMKLDEAKDFLPRYYDQKKVTDEMIESMSEVISRQGMDTELNVKYPREEVRESLGGIMTNTQRGSDEMGPITGEGDVKPIGHRSWKDVPDSVLAPILNDNFFASIDRYLMNTVKRTEVDSVFGSNGSNIEEWIGKISKEVNATNPEGVKFSKRRALTEREIKNIKDIPKLLGGTYGGKASMKGATDYALAAQMVLKLPLVTVTSIFEPITMLNRLNESTGIKDLVNVYASKAKKSFNGVPKEQLVREAKEVGLIHEAAIAERLEAMVGEGLQGIPADISKGAMKAFALHQWTEHTRSMAYQASRADLLKSIKGLAMDPSSSKALQRQEWLAEMNVDPKKAVEWYTQGAKTSDEYFETIKRGSARLANTIIANPTKINKGKSSSSNLSSLRLFTQFKGFTNVFANDVVGPTLDEATKLWRKGDKVKAMRKVSGILATVSGMAYWTTYKTGLLTGEGVVGDDEGLDVAKKMANGVTGMLIPGAAMVSPLAEGYGLGNILGPTAGDAQKVLTGKNLTGIAPTYNKIAEKVTQ